MRILLMMSRNAVKQRVVASLLSTCLFFGALSAMGAHEEFCRRLEDDRWTELTRIDGQYKQEQDQVQELNPTATKEEIDSLKGDVDLKYKLLRSLATTYFEDLQELHKSLSEEYSLESLVKEKYNLVKQVKNMRYSAALSLIEYRHLELASLRKNFCTPADQSLFKWREQTLTSRCDNMNALICDMYEVLEKGFCAAKLVDPLSAMGKVSVAPKTNLGNFTGHDIKLLDLIYFCPTNDLVQLLTDYKNEVKKYQDTLIYGQNNERKMYVVQQLLDKKYSELITQRHEYYKMLLIINRMGDSTREVYEHSKELYDTALAREAEIRQAYNALQNSLLDDLEVFQDEEQTLQQQAEADLAEKVRSENIDRYLLVQCSPQVLQQRGDQLREQIKERITGECILEYQTKQQALCAKYNQRIDQKVADLTSRLQHN